MGHNRRQPLGELLILVVLTSAAIASAGLGSQTSTADSLAGQASAAPNWEQLGIGETRWYSFDYAGDRSQIEIQLRAQPAGSAGFEVYTPEEMDRLQDLDRVEPIGRGSEDSLSAGVLSWSGSFPLGGTYGILVKRSGYATGTISYLLSVTGSGVTFAEASAAPLHSRLPRRRP